MPTRITLMLFTLLGKGPACFSHDPPSLEVGRPEPRNHAPRGGPGGAEGGAGTRGGEGGSRDAAVDTAPTPTDAGVDAPGTPDTGGTTAPPDDDPGDLDTDIAVLRLNPDGTLDPTFGDHGIARVDF